MRPYNLFCRLIALVLSVFLCLFSCLAASDLSLSTKNARDGLRKLTGISKRDSLLSQQTILPAGQTASDWLALACALQNAPEDYDAYLQALEQYVSDCYSASGTLDPGKATTWHRIALTVLALGGDPTAFGQDAQANPIDLIADGTYAYDGELDSQGLNGLLYALLTLDAKNYETPAGSRYTREAILTDILSQQNEDGGFGLVAGASDADITAMVLQALAPYQQGQAAEAVEQGLAYLKEAQDGDGYFRSMYDTLSVESTAQVVIALCCLGQDPNGAELPALDALLQFQGDDGTFAHVPGGEGDFLATEQGLLALAAAQRFYAGQSSIYDFTQYTPPKSVKSGGLLPAAYVGVAALCLLSLGFWGLRHRRQRV